MAVADTPENSNPNKTPEKPTEKKHGLRPFAVFLGVCALAFVGICVAAVVAANFWLAGAMAVCAAYVANRAYHVQTDHLSADLNPDLKPQKQRDEQKSRTEEPAVTQPEMGDAKWQNYVTARDSTAKEKSAQIS